MSTQLPARSILDGSGSPSTSAMKTALGSLRDYLSETLGSAPSISTDSSGRFLLNGVGYYARAFFGAQSGDSQCIYAHSTIGTNNDVITCHNTATTGDNKFISFYTEASPTVRGSITYNRAAGLTVYNTTSDYRAKDIDGLLLNSGEVIDSVPVYMGTMKGATQARPMFIAHETPGYAHTGEKDAVDETGNPILQQMDASALVPVLWAEVQSLRKRLAILESK